MEHSPKARCFKCKWKFKVLFSIFVREYRVSSAHVPYGIACYDILLSCMFSLVLILSSTRRITSCGRLDRE